MAEVTPPDVQMDVAPGGDLRRFAFALGTFHAAVLVVAGVLVAYAQGALDGLGDLNTALGLALFALLWTASVAGTWWALRDVQVHSLDVALRRGIGGGIRSALIVLAAGLGFFVVAVPFGVSRDGEGLAGLGNALVTMLFILGFYGTLGAVVASIIGGAIGFVFAVLDWVILAVAGIGNGFDPRNEVARSARAGERG